MDELTRLLESVENSRHYVQVVEERSKTGGNKSEVIRQKSFLAKKLFSLARLYHGNQEYTEAATLIEEAHQLVGASLESTYVLMHCLSELERWDDAYDVFLISREKNAIGRRHPLYDNPDVTLEPFGGLGMRVVDHCSRIQKPVTAKEYENWHWNRRFENYSEFAMIAEGSYERGTQTEVKYHPFEFNPCERHFSFDGLADRGIPFIIEDKPDLIVDSTYQVLVGGFLTRPQSEMDKKDAGSWLAVNLME